VGAIFEFVAVGVFFKAAALMGLPPISKSVYP
jgi:hypothetical protein